MSVNSAQTTSAETLSFEAALDALFDKILEQLRRIDLFSSSNQPVIFPVYAHDNPVAGTSHAWCVIQIIKWLEAAGCRAISDRNPLLSNHAQRGDSAAIRNILSNQLSLLPRSVDRHQAVNERTHAHKVLVFCSEVLRFYCVNASARQYLETIGDVYKECRGKPRDHLEHELHLTVGYKARNGSAWFHHVLTEIAFLKLRGDSVCRDNGIIPIALDGELPDYLPIVGPTDLILKMGSVPLCASDLHKTFFKILSQIYPNQLSTIQKFKDCYMTLKHHWASSGGSVARHSFDAAVFKCILQVHESIVEQSQIAFRHRSRDRHIEQIQESHFGNEDEELARKRRFLSTLPTVPYRDLKDRNPERDKGTCIWFKRHSKFQEWKQRNGASLLWVSADPGCGKSVLAKYLVDEVLPTTDEQGTCYFFFKDDSTDQRTLESALRCLLHQVFQHDLSLLDKALLIKLEGNSQLLHSRTDLWKILMDCFRKQSVGKFVFILDGFDECSAGDRSFLMKNLQKLCIEEGTLRIKLLLTSRPYEDIARGLRKLQNKELIIHLKGESEQELDKISREINIVIEKNVDDLGEDLELEPDVTGLIKTELTKMENRTYLWVALMMDILRNAIQTSKDAIQTLIQRLPRSVSAAYEKILRREQDDETNAKTRRLLHLILAANEPLKPGEIAVAFTMSERTPFNEEAISRDTKFIRDFSRLLIVIRDEKLYFAHQTVKEFLIMELLEPPSNALLGPCDQWAHSFHPQHSNRVLAGSCMSYIEQRSSNDRVFESYAALNWVGHLRESGDFDEIMVIRSRNLCDPTSNRFQFWFDIYWWMWMGWYLNPPTNLTDLIVASMVGLKEIVELLLHQQQDLDAKDNAKQMTAFSWACYGVHTGVAELLLDWASKANANDLNSIVNTVDMKGNSPLHEVLKGLQEKISDSNKQTSKEYILHLLLNSGANTNLQNTSGQAPLHIAIECGEAIVKLLLQVGANPGLKDSDGFTAFHRAVSKRNLAIVGVLLEHGAESNIDSQDSHHSTPLLKAIGNRSPDMVELLLKHKADVNLDLSLAHKPYSRNNSLVETRTPLIYAMDSRDWKICELLLKYGANIDLESERWKGLLLNAALYGRRETIKIVLDRGGHLNFVWYGATPLLDAFDSDDKEMVDFLLSCGADVDYPPSESSVDYVRMQKLRAFRQKHGKKDAII